MDNELHARPAIPKDISDKLTELGYFSTEFEEIIDTANKAFEEFCRLMNEFVDAPAGSPLEYYGTPGIPIPITDRVKARHPRNQIFLEKERRTRQYYPKQNRHARNIVRCR